MITYEEACMRLYAQADGEYRLFHKKLLKNENINVIGVRTPALRKLAKEWKGEWREVLGFPNEYYEIVFLKCAVAGALPFEEFCAVADGLVPLLDNWATCDCFAAPCIAKHREEFMPYVRKYLADGREFVVRYALVTLLRYYTEEKYLPLIFESVERCGADRYYVETAAAWLLAEVLVKYYDEGVAFLRENRIPKEIRNRAIRKARESFRLDSARKETLRKMKL